MKKTKNKIERFIRLNQDLLSIDPTFCLKSLQYAPHMSLILSRVKQAFQQGVAPVRLLANEAYLLKDKAHFPLAVFKPFKQKECEDSLRECIAYRLDHQNFARVPATVMTQLQHPVLGGRRIGSCQYFINAETKSCSYNRLNQDQLRRVAMLDMRLLNLDRHIHNVIIKDRDIYPIDHGSILPSQEVAAHFFWLNCSEELGQASEEEYQYLQKIDLQKDALMLEREFEMPCYIARRYVIASLFLQQGIGRGHTLAKIGGYLTCQKTDVKSCFASLLFSMESNLEEPWEVFMQAVQKQITYFYDRRYLCV